MRIRIAWVTSGCVILSLFALAGDSLLSAGWSWLSPQVVAGEQPRLIETDPSPSIFNKDPSYGTYYFGRLPNALSALTIGVPGIAHAAPGSANSPEAVDTVNNGQPVSIPIGMVVLGSDGRSMDRLAVSPGDILLRRGAIVQDESASTATVSGPLAQVEVAEQMAILDVSAVVFGDAALGTPGSARRNDVLIVLLLPSTRLSLPRGQALGDLTSEQAVQVTGTLNRRTHTMVRPTNFVVGAAPPERQCTTLSVSGDQDCAGQPVNTP